MTAQGQEVGASCDELLVSNPELLNETQWLALKAQWLANKGVPECTPSYSMLDLKVFIEDVCSEVTCDESTKIALEKSFERLAKLGERQTPDLVTKDPQE